MLLLEELPRKEEEVPWDDDEWAVASEAYEQDLHRTLYPDDETERERRLAERLGWDKDDENDYDEAVATDAAAPDRMFNLQSV